MLRKHAIISFTYYVQKDFIDFIDVEFNQKGEVISQKEQELRTIHEGLRIDLNGILEYLEENYDVKESDLYEVVVTLGDKISFSTIQNKELNSSPSDQEVPSYFVIDDEVLEWINIIKKYLLQDID